MLCKNVYFVTEMFYKTFKNLKCETFCVYVYSYVYLIIICVLFDMEVNIFLFFTKILSSHGRLQLVISNKQRHYVRDRKKICNYVQESVKIRFEKSVDDNLKNNIFPHLRGWK